MWNSAVRRLRSWDCCGLAEVSITAGKVMIHDFCKKDSVFNYSPGRTHSVYSSVCLWMKYHKWITVYIIKTLMRNSRHRVSNHNHDITRETRPTRRSMSSGHWPHTDPPRTHPIVIDQTLMPGDQRLGGCRDRVHVSCLARLTLHHTALWETYCDEADIHFRSWNKQFCGDFWPSCPG